MLSRGNPSHNASGLKNYVIFIMHSVHVTIPSRCDAVTSCNWEIWLQWRMKNPDLVDVVKDWLTQGEALSEHFYINEKIITRCHGKDSFFLKLWNLA